MSFCREWFVRDNNSDCRNPKIDDDSTERIMKMFEALKLIDEMPGNNGKIKCPKCGNDLHWTRASFNKHVWGKCKTDNCLLWMQ
jgi:hypothetical protein